MSPLVGVLASVGVAFIPKCPVCWATYLSMFGIAGLDGIPLPPWLQPLLAVVLLLNVASAWFRARATGRVSAPLLASAGAAVILASRSVPGWESAATWGVALVFIGSLLGAFDWRRREPAVGEPGLKTRPTSA